MISIKVSLDPKALKATIDEAAVREYTETVVKAGAKNAGDMMPNGPTPSKPYNPPAIQTGELKGSLNHRVLDAYTGQVFETADHAQYLEYGSRYGKIKPRPHMFPGLCKAIEDTPIPTNIIKIGGK